MDFPGVDPDHKELFQPYIEHIDQCHTFIFIIDVHRDHGVHGPTVGSQYIQTMQIKMVNK